jgi:hypothetical protein
MTGSFLAPGTPQAEAELASAVAPVSWANWGRRREREGPVLRTLGSGLRPKAIRFTRENKDEPVCVCACECMCETDKHTERKRDTETEGDEERQRQTETETLRER